MKRGLLIATLCLATFPAMADDWFVQADLGATKLPLDRLEDNDPVGAVFTLNEKNGTGILPRNVRQQPWGLSGDASVGLFREDFFLRATYRHSGAGPRPGRVSFLAILLITGRRPHCPNHSE